jgi:hypothetical protein
MGNPLVDRGHELDGIVEGTSPYALSWDLGEEPLDQIEPRAGCRCEMQHHFDRQAGFLEFGYELEFSAPRAGRRSR